MKRFIIKFILFIVSFLPLRRIIVFESVPDFADNPKYVFEEMINRGINKKYKLVWLVENPKKDFPRLKNVYYVSFDSLAREVCVRLAKCLVCCNYWIGTHKKGQKSFYLTHGTAVKKVKGYYSMPHNIDYCLTASDNINPILQEQLEAPAEKFLGLGLPRNDCLNKEKKDLHKIFRDVEFDKVIIWMPTYRQHKRTKRSISVAPIPLLHNADDIRQLNEIAIKNKVLIVIKPHFVQDTTLIKETNASNIKIIDDDFIKNQNIDSYEFMGSCDALISDYSSTYYDYTLCDKPIALVWEDYDAYKSSPGIADGVEKLLEAGIKVYNLKELNTFIESVADGEDTLKDIRRNICDIVNHSRDGKNTQRVTDFIIAKAKIKY